MSWFKERLQRADSRLGSLLDSQDHNGRNGHSSQTRAASSSQATKDGQQQQSTPQNETLFQAFEWHTPSHHWQRLQSTIPALADVGVTALWLPPGCKANSPQGNGYDCYDLWDLGEFDQKWTRRTKWGSREELAALMHEARRNGVKVLWDAVLNHKTAGDQTEECWAVEVNPEDRNIETSRPRKIEPWIHYNFPGRGDKYSSLKWHWQHFNGTDWDQRAKKHALYKIVDPPETHPRPGAAPTKTRRKGWAEDVDDAQGNADYLMFSNIDYTNEEVRQDVLRWGEWMVHDVGVDGFRLDAVPHYSWRFAREWIARVQAAARQDGRSCFVVGEFWSPKVAKLIQWTDNVGPDVRAFDVPLLNHFSKVSQARGKWDVDLRKIFLKTLVDAKPGNAVTVVTNHDTQPGQAMATVMAPFFKPLAYALTLLRQDGLPCVFYGDLYGTQGPHSEKAACNGQLPALLLCRKLYAYGPQADVFESRSCIGWTRQGTWDRSDGCAVVMSISGLGKTKMNVGRACAGQRWTDVLGNCSEVVTIDDAGFGRFSCAPRSVSVFVREDGQGREQFKSSANANRFKL